MLYSVDNVIFQWDLESCIHFTLTGQDQDTLALIHFHQEKLGEKNEANLNSALLDIYLSNRISLLYLSMISHPLDHMAPRAVQRG